MSAPPPVNSSLSGAGLVFAPAQPATPSGALRLGPADGADAVQVPAALAPSATSIPLPATSLGALHGASAPLGGDAVLAPVVTGQAGSLLLGLPDEPSAPAGVIASWVPGAANDAGGRDDPEVDAVVHATLAGLLGADTLAEADVLAPGRDLAEPATATLAFMLDEADEDVFEPGAIAAAVAMSGAAMGDVMLAVDGMKLVLLSGDAPADEAGAALQAPGPDEGLELLPPHDDAPVYGAGDAVANDTGHEDAVVIDLVGDAGGPGLAFL